MTNPNNTSSLGDDPIAAAGWLALPPANPLHPRSIAARLVNSRWLVGCGRSGERCQRPGTDLALLAEGFATVTPVRSITEANDTTLTW
jgi:hypothetical protein